MTVLMFVALWLLGTIAFYILDGFFDFGLEQSSDAGFVFFVCIVWPISLVLILADAGRDRAKRFRLNLQSKRECRERIRIAQVKEAEALQKKAEMELADFISELEQDSKKKSAHL